MKYIERLYQNIQCERPIQRQVKNIYRIYYLLFIKNEKKKKNPAIQAMLFFHLMMYVIMSCKEGTGMVEGSSVLQMWSRSLRAFCTSYHMLKEQRSFTAITWNK